jgi:hypothetical protein
MKPIIPLLLTAATALAASPVTHTDESKVPAYTLPDPLVSDNGTPVKSPAEWPARRAEILAHFEKHIYGITPPAAIALKPVARETQNIPDFLAGKATLREIELTFPDTPKAPTLHLLLITPNKTSSPPPVFLGLNFRGNHTIHPDPRITLSTRWIENDPKAATIDHRATEASRGTSASRWPLDLILSRGYAIATLYCGDIEPDHPEGIQQSIRSAFPTPGDSGWGAIAAWSWGLSKALDHLSSSPAVNGKQVALLGHSRLGKTALWAGATDERFAFVVSNNSGCGGAALSRRAFGETVARINHSFPHWFARTFRQYNDNESALPVDQHQLLALIAPRPLHVASATQDLWADPKGERLALDHAKPVYQLLGKDPALLTTYHIREGAHEITAEDWSHYLDSADRHFSRTPSP